MKIWNYGTAFRASSSHVPRLTFNFHEQAAPSYNLTQRNLSVCLERNCSQRLLQLFAQALDLAEKVEHYPLNFFDHPEAFLPANIPFNRPCFISHQQVMQLSINTSDLCSNLPELSDSRFEYKMLGLGRYFIRRVKK